MLLLTICFTDNPLELILPGTTAFGISYIWVLQLYSPQGLATAQVMMVSCPH
jgi:hypothetical protein